MPVDKRAFSVSFWIGNPEVLSSQLCFRRIFATEHEAFMFSIDEAVQREFWGSSHILLAGPYLYQLEKNQFYDADRAEEEEAEEMEASEARMMAGMAFGCAGYNDSMGW